MDKPRTSTADSVVKLQRKYSNRRTQVCLYKDCYGILFDEPLHVYARSLLAYVFDYVNV